MKLFNKKQNNIERPTLAQMEKTLEIAKEYGMIRVPSFFRKAKRYYIPATKEYIIIL